jgi:carbamoyl-phosphate synthase large subunit
MAPQRILLLSGASLVGQNVLACLAPWRDRLVVAATSSVADDPFLFEFDRVYHVPQVRSDPLAHATRFDDVIGHFEPDLVVPCRDDDVSFVAARRDSCPEEAHRLLCGDAAVASAMLDKLKGAQFSAARGLPFVPTLAADGNVTAALRFAASHGWPLIAKPRRGFASRGVRLLLTEGQLERACAAPDTVIQKYVGDAGAVRRAADDVAENGLPLFLTTEETKLSLQACIGPDGEVTAAFASGNVMRMGRSEAVQLVDDAASVVLARRWAGVFAQAGWRGPLNIQCQRDADGAVAIYEYNGRFTGATAARQLLGFDEVRYVLRDWLGFAAGGPTLRPAREVLRYLVGRPRREDDARRLLRDGCWERDAGGAR